MFIYTFIYKFSLLGLSQWKLKNIEFLLKFLELWNASGSQALFRGLIMEINFQTGSHK